MGKWPKAFFHLFMVISGIAALLSGARIFYYFFVMMLVIRVSSSLSLRHYLDNIFLRTAVDHEEIIAGESLKITFRLTNASLLPLWHGRIALKLPEGMKAISVVNHGVYLGPQETLPFNAEVMCPLRGYYGLGEATLALADPMGFSERAIKYSHEIAITVFPKVVPLPPLLFQPRAEGGNLKAPSRSIDDRTHTMNLREYVKGDDLKSIHWKLSAKRESLVVREYHKSVSERLTVFMDGFYGNWGGAFDAEEEERMVSFCASYLKGAAEKGLAFTLHLNNLNQVSYRGDNAAEINASMAILTAFKSDGAEAFEVFLNRKLENTQVYEHVVFIVPRVTRELVHFLSRVGLTYDLFALRMDSEVMDFPNVILIGPLMGGSHYEGL